MFLWKPKNLQFMDAGEKDTLFLSFAPVLANVRYEREHPEQKWTPQSPTEMAEDIRAYIGEECWQYVCQRAGFDR
jgi:hypothetical protein